MNTNRSFHGVELGRKSRDELVALIPSNDTGPFATLGISNIDEVLGVQYPFEMPPDEDGVKLQQPLPLKWFAAAAECGHQAATLGVLLWFHADLTGSAIVTAGEEFTEAFGFTDAWVTRRLKELEQAGLIKILWPETNLVGIRTKAPVAPEPKSEGFAAAPGVEIPAPPDGEPVAIAAGGGA